VNAVCLGSNQVAQSIGRVVAPDAVLATARTEATRLAGLARSAFRATKKRLRGRTIAHIRASMDEDLRDLMTPTA